MIQFGRPLVLLGLIGLAPFIFWLVRRSPRWPSLLRGAALFLLVLALAEPRLGLPVRESYIYFALDLSGSISQPREELLGLIAPFMARHKGVQYGLILFGAEAAIDQGFKPELDLEDVSTVIPREGTDLAGALALALAGFPEEGQKGLVLLSDGLITGGRDALRLALAQAQMEGVRIAALPLRPESGETWLSELSLPEEVPPETEFSIRLKAGALKAANARLLIYRDGQLLEARALELAPGVNELVLADRLEEPGFHHYRAHILAEGDAILENNSAEALVLVRGGPQVLWLTEAEDEGQGAVGRLLQAAGYPYLRSSPARFSWSPAELAPYRLVVLDNLGLVKLEEQAISALERYVEGGGGLLLIQGQRAVTGLRRTGLERLLPISYEGREPSQAPSLAVVFVLDRSSSMIGKKIQALKEAAGASVELLERRDLVGLLAFDTMFHWLVPIQPAENKEPMYRQIGALQADGGTDLLPALAEAFQKLSAVEARLKHILVFSDGKALLHEQEFPQLLEQIKEAKITVSALAIGEDADVPFLRGLTDATGGKLYLVKDPQDLPRLTLKEVERVTRQRWLTGEIGVAPGPYAHLLGLGLEDLTPLPPLGGYVVTYPKETSEVALLSEQGDPLLSFWRLGLGRVGVLNTDLEGRWSAAWLGWEGLPDLFSSLVRQTYGLPSEEGISVQAETEGSTLALTAEISLGGRWADLLEVRGRLANGTTGKEFAFEQVGPGLYRAELEALEPEAYLLSLSAEREDQEIAAKMEPLVVPYPEEYRQIGTDELLLEELVAATGGSFLEDRLPEEFLRGRPVYKYQEIWPLALGLALGAFLADLALRKFT